MSKSKSTYNDWLRHIGVLIKQLEIDILNDSPIMHNILVLSRKPPMIRLIVDKDFIDFKVKEIRSSTVKFVWLGKVANINQDVNYIIHSKKENEWLSVTGRVIVNRAEQKLSDYHNKAMMYVIERSYLRDFRRYLDSLDYQSEKKKQKKLDGFV